MRNKLATAILALSLLLTLVPFVQGVADPVSEPGSGNATAPGKPPSDSSSTGTGEKSAEASENTQPAAPFIPSETISADSAIAFPVDI
jgi:hypothetical protein